MIKQFKITILIFLFPTNLAFGQIGYETQYANDKGISYLNGIPKSSSSIYLPSIESKDTLKYVKLNGNIKIIPDIHHELYLKEFGEEKLKDTIQTHHIVEPLQKWYSKYLYEFEEPILSNFYLEKEIIRFTLLRSFDKPILIRAEKSSNNFELIFKVLNRRLDVDIFASLLKSGDNSQIDENLAYIEICDTVKLSNSQYSKLDSLIESTKIKEENPFLNYITGEDGADWIIEIHSHTGYYYQVRRSPDQQKSIRKIAEYLKQLSRKNFELY